MYPDLRSDSGISSNRLQRACMNDIVQLLRPRHWVKNLFIFLPPLFSEELTNSHNWLSYISTFLAFCMLASAVYAMNDALDAEQDRQHPHKRTRPVAAGQLTKRSALLTAGVLFVAALAWAYALHKTLFGIMLIYAANNVAYSWRLKHVVILDVMMIAFGFILRMLAGAVFITKPFSPWVFLCTFFLALFLGFAKRRAELSTLVAESWSHQLVLNHYTSYLLDQLLSALMAITILCYSLYASSDYTRERFHSTALLYTIPFVVYGIFRYFQQVQLGNKGEDPGELLFSDTPTLVNILLWGLACFYIIYA